MSTNGVGIYPPRTPDPTILAQGMTPEQAQAVADRTTQIADSCMTIRAELADHDVTVYVDNAQPGYVGVDWGDGFQDVEVEVSDPSQSPTFTHTYGQDGIWTITAANRPYDTSDFGHEGPVTEVNHIELAINWPPPPVSEYTPFEEPA